MGRPAVKYWGRSTMVIVNGRYLTAPPTGVQRVAAGHVIELDRRLDDDELQNWSLYAPSQATLPPLRRLATRTKGLIGGQIWEQAILPGAATTNTILSFCNSAPLLGRHNVVMIHDAQTFSSPQSYSAAFRSWYRFMLPFLGRHADMILTGSQFSKSQLCAFGICTAERIQVLPHGVDHLVPLTANPSAVRQLELEHRPFVVALANTQAHKNIRVLLDAFRSSELTHVELVLVGRADRSDFVDAGLEPPSNVTFSGPVSDAELKALMQFAIAMAFPSKTEGFGLPPLEAMSVGCAAVVAPEASLPELCGQAAIYAQTDRPEDWAAAIASLAFDNDARRRVVERGFDRAHELSWKRSGERLRELMRPFV